MHSHHSHSGDYVAHAADSLESVIQRVLFLQFQTFCLTEHMPRYDMAHLYPEELERKYGPISLEENFEKYYAHAKLIKSKLNSDPGCPTKILIGFETEGGLESDASKSYLELALQIRHDKEIDLVVGSVHHINGIPLDFDRKTWEDAKASCSDDMEEYFSAYFELQYNLLVALKPEVVGHFDLIRLMLKESDEDLLGISYLSENYIETYWPKVWKQVLRNIDFINSYGGLIELNSAAFRKGWDTPYPKRDIVRLALSRGGKFCFSDDSHGIKQVGLNYFKLLDFCESCGIDEISYWDLDLLGKTVSRTIGLDEVKKHPFWTQLKTLT